MGNIGSITGRSDDSTHVIRDIASREWFGRGA